MRLASISATAHARACSRMRSASSSRRSCVSFLESSRPTMRRRGIQHDCGGDHRTKQRAASNFVDATDAHPSLLTRQPFISRRAEPPHRARFYHTHRGGFHLQRIQSAVKITAAFRGAASREKTLVTCQGTKIHSSLFASAVFPGRSRSTRLMRADFPVSPRR